MIEPPILWVVTFVPEEQMGERRPYRRAPEDLVTN